MFDVEQRTLTKAVLNYQMRSLELFVDIGSSQRRRIEALDIFLHDI